MTITGSGRQLEPRGDMTWTFLHAKPSAPGRQSEISVPFPGLAWLVLEEWSPTRQGNWSKRRRKASPGAMAFVLMLEEVERGSRKMGRTGAGRRLPEVDPMQPGTANRSQRDRRIACADLHDTGGHQG